MRASEPLRRLGRALSRALKAPKGRKGFVVVVVLVLLALVAVIVFGVVAWRRRRLRRRRRQDEFPAQTYPVDQQGQQPGQPGPGAPQSSSGPPAGLGVPPAGAIVANHLSDFRTVDNSLVYPRGAGPEIVNITEIGPRVFRFLLRHRGSWHDGDRDKNDPKKSRAEVSGLYPRGMQVGETWIVGTTVRLDPSFVPARGYQNILQVFDQAYLTLGKVRGDQVDAELMAFSNGIGSSARSVRKWTITRGQWTSIRIRIKFATNGRYEVSVNDDPFQGIDIDTTKGCRPCSTKFGIYGPVGTNVNGEPLKDLIAQHSNIYMSKVA
jgi:hypothetical protein